MGKIWSLSVWICVLGSILSALAFFSFQNVRMNFLYILFKLTVFYLLYFSHIRALRKRLVGILLKLHSFMTYVKPFVDIFVKFYVTYYVLKIFLYFLVCISLHTYIITFPLHLVHWHLKTRWMHTWNFSPENDSM